MMRVVERWVPRVLAIQLGAVAIVALLAPRNPWFVWPLPRVWGATAAVLLLYLVLRRTLGGWMRTVVARSPRASVLGGTAVGALVVSAHVPLASIPFGWDAYNVFVAASNVAAGVPQDPPGLVGYFARFPNNLPLLATEATAARVGSWFGASPLVSMLVVQTCGVIVIIGCLGAAVLRLGQPGAVWPVQALATFVLGLGPQAAIPYSDLPAAACVAVVLWASARGWTGAGRRWWLVALVALAGGIALKPYVVALGLGALALLPRHARRYGYVPAVLVAALAAGAVVVGVLGLHTAAGRVSGITAEVRADYPPAHPPLHFMVMGTHDNGDPSPTRTYGGWHGPQSARTGEVADPAERRAMLRQTLAEQLSDQGVVGTVSFLGQKIAWFWGDGTFYAHGEAADREREGSLGESWAQVQQWFIGSGQGYRDVTAPIRQGVWISILVIVSAGLWRARPSPWVLTCATTLLALTGYLMLFEARARYLIALVPVLLLLAGLVSGRPGRADGVSGGPPAGLPAARSGR